MYKLKLKRKYLVILTIVATLASIKILDLSIKLIIKQNEKAATQCERQFKHKCNSQELNYYFKNIK